MLNCLTEVCLPIELRTDFCNLILNSVFAYKAEPFIIQSSSALSNKEYNYFTNGMRKFQNQV